MSYLTTDTTFRFGNVFVSGGKTENGLVLQKVKTIDWTLSSRNVFIGGVPIALASSDTYYSIMMINANLGSVIDSHFYWGGVPRAIFKDNENNYLALEVSASNLGTYRNIIFSGANVATENNQLLITNKTDESGSEFNVFIGGFPIRVKNIQGRNYLMYKPN